MKSTIASVFLLVAAFAMPAAGQLAAPNAAGVSVGHIHLVCQRCRRRSRSSGPRWAAFPSANQRLEMIQFPGVFILAPQGRDQGRYRRFDRESPRLRLEGSAGGEGEMAGRGIQD